ncbi:MAG TPA: DNA polymerase III subunit delta' [Aliidongia sp.]|uniref:DNA polymerase III subunit delta' n=1 Tax=Aliidongia sp. TaxID=1914230 RepID=UPI002DDD11C6|nr:DNA polymerase III subunit delta' [Aliidongia sp.]HEV2677995.1 DNA polymerase III subunit delta' [Aliidongia sp.]
MAAGEGSGDEAEADPRAPRRNPDLFGHAVAEAGLLQAVASGRLPHAIILGGPRGIGKATLAFRFARWLLAGAGADDAGPSLFGEVAVPTDLHVDPGHPVARRISAAGHADLLTVERGWDPKRKKMRGEIVVDDVREVSHFLRMTSAEGGWRIVVIDSADEMNRNAANALLKVLEEPPKRALLLLVCHAPGRLLPTIRSRCRKLFLQPLAAEEVVRLLRDHRPDLAADDAAILARMADGSVGRALELADAEGLVLYREMVGLLDTLPKLDGVRLHRLADAVARGEAEELYRTLTDLLVDFLARMVAGAAEGTSREVLPGEGTLMRRMAGFGRLDQWVEVWENLRALFGRADAVNLDRKQVVLDAFFTLGAAAR